MVPLQVLWTAVSLSVVDWGHPTAILEEANVQYLGEEETVVLPQEAIFLSDQDF